MNSEIINEEPNHSKETGRLNRIRGQIDGIKKMIEGHRSCKEILSQLKAVRSAVRSVEASILQRQLQYNVVQSFKSENDREKIINETKELFNDFHE
ncbi:MAG: metal-sensitive transcriptional regulator [Alphaproteobacteria bacterium]|nr:metal-sensitive transcriptional regulator [Alphaproteobacteria bacterium]MBO4643245.1 metal-sensitive transcriptional regulator [Alphaproteobacteria bacterium]